MTRAPSPTELRVLTILAAAYGALTLAVLPWAGSPGPRNPDIIIASNLAIAFADFCTAGLLGREFRREPRISYLLIACGYLFSAVMALAHLAVFGGALFDEPLFGTPQTTSWVFIAWRLGTGALFLSAVAAARRPARDMPQASRMHRLLAGVVATLSVAAGACILATWVQVEVVSGTRFTPLNLGLIVLFQAINVVTLFLIARGRAFGDKLYLWLAIVVVASMTDQILGTLSGAQYTLGWNVAKASGAISAFVLLVLWMGSSRPGVEGSATRLAADLGAAAGVTLAAILLRWFLTPWIGVGYPYATLFGAVAISVWIGGWLPATLSAAGGAGAIAWIFPDAPLLPEHDAAALFGFVMYAISCAFIIVLGESMRRLERELRLRAAELQAVDENKSRFLAMLSHELRNPLAPLVNGLGILRMNPHAEASERTRGMMERQVHHLRRLVDDLLDMSRIDQGKLQVHLERVDVQAAVRSAMETVAPLVESKAQRLSARLPEAPIVVHADPVRLAQVVGNLLHNAAKFAPDGGRIEVEARVEEGHAVVAVSDDGPGFEPGQADRIFGMFVQLPAEMGSASGLGLGLTLVRSLVELHGGTVQAASEGPGRGATFTVRMPLAPPAELLDQPVLHRVVHQVHVGVQL